VAAVSRIGLQDEAAVLLQLFGQLLLLLGREGWRCSEPCVLWGPHTRFRAAFNRPAELLLLLLLPAVQAQGLSKASSMQPWVFLTHHAPADHNSPYADAGMLLQCA
jgi:hypothetical protein